MPPAFNAAEKVGAKQRGADTANPRHCGQELIERLRVVERRLLALRLLDGLAQDDVHARKDLDGIRMPPVCLRAPPDVRPERLSTFGGVLGREDHVGKFRRLVPAGG